MLGDEHEKIILALVLIALPVMAFAAGNTTNDSFNAAKKMLERQVYYDHRVTLYCGADFDAQKRVTLPEGFSTPAHKKRTNRVEWEHVIYWLIGTLDNTNEHAIVCNSISYKRKYID